MCADSCDLGDIVKEELPDRAPCRFPSLLHGWKIREGEARVVSYGTWRKSPGFVPW